MRTPQELQTADRQGAVITEHKYNSESVITVDFGPNYANLAVDVVDDTAIVITDDEQFEFELPNEASEELQHATEAADGEIQRHLNSIDEGLMELAEGDKITEAEVDADRMAELEEKLAGLSAETDDQAIVSHIENALDQLDAAEDGFGES